MKQILFTATILLTTTTTATLAAPVAVPSLFRHQITIIGENHRHANSTKWFLTTVSNYVKSGKCLNAALEIESSQQSVLNNAMKGNAPVSSIHINSIIDHPAYRQMLAGFSSLITDGSCLNVYAIDAPRSVNVNRDQWMAKEIFSIGKSATTIALLGNLHALKHVNWYREAKGEPLLAERLQLMGMDVFSVIQDWPPESCNTRHIEFQTTNTLEGRKALKHVLAPVAAIFPSNPKSAIDMTIVWNCQ